jgi:hypothetical protein
MYRFYRKHYAATRSLLTNAAVYGGIAAKCAFAIAAAPVRRRLGA